MGAASPPRPSSAQQLSRRYPFVLSRTAVPEGPVSNHPVDAAPNSEPPSSRLRRRACPELAQWGPRLRPASSTQPNENPPPFMLPLPPSLAGEFDSVGVPLVGTQGQDLAGQPSHLGERAPQLHETRFRRTHPEPTVLLSPSTRHRNRNFPCEAPPEIA